MSELSPAAKAALEGYRQEQTLPASVQAHLKEQLRVRLAQGATPLPDVQASLSFVEVAPSVPWYASLPAKLSMLGLSMASVATVAVMFSAEPREPPATKPALPVISALHDHAPEAPIPSVATSIEPNVSAPPVRQAPAPIVSAPRPAHRVSGKRSRAAREPVVRAAKEAMPDAPPFGTASSPAANMALPQAVEPVVAPREPAPQPAQSSRPVNQLSAELSLLQAAHAALERRDFRAAHAALDEHTVRFPHGELKALRDVTRLLARCHESKDAPARDAAQAYLRAHPRSPYAARVRSACE